MAPGSLAQRKPGPLVVSEDRPCPSHQMECCLQWLDVDRMKGGCKAAWIREKFSLPCPDPEARSPEFEKTPQVERREARVLVIQHAAPPQGARL